MDANRTLPNEPSRTLQVGEIKFEYLSGIPITQARRRTLQHTATRRGSRHYLK
jgi:hypothetical protein